MLARISLLIHSRLLTVLCAASLASLLSCRGISVGTAVSQPSANPSSPAPGAGNASQGPGGSQNGTNQSGSGTGNQGGGGSNGGQNGTGGSGSGTPSSTANAEPRFVVIGEDLGSCCSDRSWGDVAAMQFDAATASLGQAFEGFEYSFVLPAQLAYRVAAAGTTIYAAQLVGGPEVQIPFGEAYSIDSSAKLTALPGHPFLAGTEAASVAIHPSGKFIYFSQNVYNKLAGVGGYRLDANGVPQPLPGSPFYPKSIGDAGMIVEPSGHFLFAMPPSTYLKSGDTEVYTFPIDTTGELANPTITNVSSDVSTGACTCLQVSPDGKYLYAATNNTIAVLAIDSQKGTLAPVPGSPYPTAARQIASFAISSDGNFLFVSDCCTNTIEVFATNRSTTGIITPSGLPLVSPPGDPPHALATQGHFVFVGTSIYHPDFTGSTVTGSISVYALDSSSGSLRLRGTFSTPGGPGTMIAVP